MNYYDEMIDRIKRLIDDEKYDEAGRLIANELEMPYVPKDAEEKLKELYDELCYFRPAQKDLSDKKIEEYLFSDSDHQLLAVNELDHRNLREYIPLCEHYLSSEGFANAKALLIDSLIAQQIDHIFECCKGKEKIRFNPSLMKRVNETDVYRFCLRLIYEAYLKEPSKAKLAEQLLYKEFLMALPLEIEEEDCNRLSQKIIAFIDQAFDS